MLRDLSGQVLRIVEEDPPGSFAWGRDYIRGGGRLLARASGAGTQHATVDHLGSPRLWTNGSAGVAARYDYLPFGELTAQSLETEPLKYTGHERDDHLSGGCGSGTTPVNNQTISTGQTFTGCDAVTSENTTVTSTTEVKFVAGERIELGEDFSVANGAVFTAEVDGDLKGARQDLDYMHARYCSPYLGRFQQVDPVLRLRRASHDPQQWNRYSYARNNPVVHVDPTGEIFIVAADTREGAQDILELAQQALREANALEEAELLQLEEIDGEYRITSGDMDLSASENSTVALIGATINAKQRVSVGFTDESLSWSGGARGKYDHSGQYNIRINRETISYTIVQGVRSNGGLVGLTVSDATALVHELGHPAGSFLHGIRPYPAGLTNSTALRYENEHRKLMARPGHAPVLRIGHGRQYP